MVLDSRGGRDHGNFFCRAQNLVWLANPHAKRNPMGGVRVSYSPVRVYLGKRGVWGGLCPVFPLMEKKMRNLKNILVKVTVVPYF